MREELDMMNITIGILAAALVALGCNNQAPKKSLSTSPAITAPDDSWVAVTGTVVESDPHAFKLDYGAGVITVEMDDWDWFPEGEQLLPNDEVVVYGYVDDDFLEKRTIEASSVYVKDLGAQFYASGVDEEDFFTTAIVDFRPRIEVTGTVKKVEGRTFDLDLGTGSVTVDTETMAYNPLDDEGFQQLEAGDRVRVTGALSRELFSDLDLQASYVVTLENAGAAAQKGANEES